MSQTRVNNVSAAQSEKLSPRLLKSPPTMTSKQPAVFLTRYVWSRNRPVCSLRESPSSSSKLPLSEKIRTGSLTEAKPQQRSSSVSMRPPGSPVWPPRSLRWSKQWDVSLGSNAPLPVTAKCQPTACSEMWLPVSISTTFATLSAVQMSTISQNQVVLSSAQVTGMSPGPIGESAVSLKMTAAPQRLPATSDAATSAKPSALGNSSKNFSGNPRMRNGSSRTVRKSSTAPRQPQQSMRWPPRSVKWPNRWNKFSSVSRFSSESSARSTDSTSVPLDNTSVERPLTPKQVTSTQISRTSPRLQKNSVQSQVLERLPLKTSIPKEAESSLESSPASSPLSERSSQWTDSLETSGMSPVGSTQSSPGSGRSPAGPTRPSGALTDQLTIGVPRSKESRKSEMKSSAQKCDVRSTTSSVSSSWRSEDACSVLIQSTGQSLKSRKLQGQSPARPAVSSSSKRLQRKRSEFSKPPVDDTSSSLESTTQSPSPAPPLSSTRIIQSEVKLVRSATWPTELILKPKSAHLLPEYSMTKESEPESPFADQRTLPKPLRPSSSVSAISLLKMSPSGWERKRSSDMPLLSSSSSVVPCVSEHRFTQLSDSSTMLENAPILCKPLETTTRASRSSSKCLSAVEETRPAVSSPTLQKYSPLLTSSSTIPPSFNDTSASQVSSKLVRVTTASIPVSQVSTKELKGSMETAAMLLVWPTKPSPTLRAPVVTAPTAAQGDSWKYRRSPERSQLWPQTQSVPMNLLPIPTVSSEPLRRSQATFSTRAAPAYTGVHQTHFSLSSSQSSKSWPSQGTSVNVLPRCPPAHLISSMTQLSLSPEESPVSLKTEKNAPRMLKKSSPAPPCFPTGMIPLADSSSVRYLKRNTRTMMAPTLSTKFQSSSAFCESSPDIHLAHSSVSPSWPLLPGTPETPSTSLGQSDRYWTEATRCLPEQNLHASHLAASSGQSGSYTQSKNSSFAMSSTLLQSPTMSSQLIPAEPGEVPQKSCSRQSPLCPAPCSPSFQPSSFLTSTANVSVHTTPSFPLVYSSTPPVSCRVTQTQTSTVWISGNLGKSVTCQAPIDPTSNARHTPFVPSASVAVQSVTSASLSTKSIDRSEIVPGVSHAEAQPMTPGMWMPVLEVPPPSSPSELLPPRSEVNVMWTSDSCSKLPATSADTHSQLGSHISDTFPVSAVTSACTSSRLPAPPWSAATSVFPPITSTAMEQRLPMFNWISSGPFWMPAQFAGPSCSSSTAQVMTTAPALPVSRSSQTWASSAAQLSTVVPSSKGPVVSAVVHTTTPQSEPSVSWSRSRPPAWRSTASTSTTGQTGFQTEPSSGLVRLPIKYIKRQPLPRTGDIESSSSTS